MKKNMGKADSITRLLIALAIAALYFFGAISGTLAIVLLVVAVVFTLTAIVGFCPLYSLFSISTRKKPGK